MIKRLLPYALASVVVLVLAITAIGYMLPQGHIATAERVIARPPAEVFVKISDVSRYPEWRTDIDSVEVIASAPLTWREGTRGDTVTYEVVESLAPQRFVVRIADPGLPFGGTWTYELRPDGTGTHVTITERGEVYNPIFRFISRFFMSQTATMEKVLSALGPARV